MARPRVFVSSTYYDLRHVRASLEPFIRSLGFEPILSERGNIPYDPELPLDESCYREVQSSDIYLLIVGGRYGSRTSRHASDSVGEPTNTELYESVTRTEFEEASRRGIPCYICIERRVAAEYEVFKANRERKDVKYPGVESLQVFDFVDSVSNRSKNNPTFAFEEERQIEDWLREQWAGLFQDLLRRRSEQVSLASLGNQIDQLKDNNDTLKRYLEELISRDGEPHSAERLIQTETMRLAERGEANLLNNYASLARWLGSMGVRFTDAIAAIKKSATVSQLAAHMAASCSLPIPLASSDFFEYFTSTKFRDYFEAIEQVRNDLGLPRFNEP